MIETLISWSLLPLGIALGLALARQRAGVGDGGTASGPLAADPGSATPPADDPVELQLTLGRLFRKRGEIDRAIQLHEAVLAHPRLSAQDEARATLELAQDFLRSGVIDRAEGLLDGLVQRGQHLDEALELLLELHEQGRDWPLALATAARLQSVQGRSQAPRIAQHHCELADQARYDGQREAAQRHLARALDADPDCARASLLQMALAEADADWRAAIRWATRAIGQDRRYLAEALPTIRRAHEALGDDDGYAQWLSDAEADHPDAMPVILAKADWLATREGDAQAWLAARLLKTPHWRGLLVWIELAMPGYATAGALTASFRKQLDAQPRYACTSCGLRPSVLFWQCPSCRQWASIVPARPEP